MFYGGLKKCRGSVEHRLHNIDKCSSDELFAYKAATTRTTATQTLDICSGKGGVKQQKLKEKEKKTASEMRQEPQMSSPDKDYYGKQHELKGREKIAWNKMRAKPYLHSQDKYSNVPQSKLVEVKGLKVGSNITSNRMHLWDDDAKQHKLKRRERTVTDKTSDMDVGGHSRKLPSFPVSCMPFFFPLQNIQLCNSDDVSVYKTATTKPAATQTFENWLDKDYDEEDEMLKETEKKTGGEIREEPHIASLRRDYDGKQHKLKGREKNTGANTDVATSTMLQDLSALPDPSWTSLSLGRAQPLMGSQSKDDEGKLYKSYQSKCTKETKNVGFKKTAQHFGFDKLPLLPPEKVSHPHKILNTKDCWFEFPKIRISTGNSYIRIPSSNSSHSISSSVAEPSCQAGILNKWSTCADEMQKHTGSGLSSVQSETMSGGSGKLPGETGKLPNNFSTSSLQKFDQDKIPQLASLSRLSLSKPQNLCTKAQEVFTPDFTEDFDDETYRFQCSSPGLYKCSVTSLVFHMEGEGDVLYRIVPWNRRLLSQYHKKPAGPLFDIKCLQQSVCQLHLPHCEILSTGGCNFLSVVHITDDGIEFISPHKITETHVIINITGFSGFGNVKDEDSPPDLVKALVLLFYKLPDNLDDRSLLNVLLVPRNIVIRDLQHTRGKLIGDERYIDVSPHCKLQPKQAYSLSTDLGSELAKVQPTEAEFDEESHNSYFTSFQVILKTIVRVINLRVENMSSSCCVWEREVCLFPSTVTAPNVRPVDRLLGIRRSFIEGTSGAVLQSLVDKLLETKVITDSEREAAEEKQSRRDKAQYVSDTVRRKGDAAISKMIEFLCEADPFFCEHVGLTQREMQQ